MRHSYRQRKINLIFTRKSEDILGCEVDLLTRRSVENDENEIRRRAILQAT
ncbi:MAG TPA: hypothetical protein VKG25_19000 [Bryobacteraceae bacterium]|nr:hypothetical protein [Bryobacteraceae bacterium]